MLTYVEFRSAEFPAYDGKEEEINPGRFGKQLAEFIALGLKAEGETINELISEDWGWLIPIDNLTFTLWALETMKNMRMVFSAL